MSKPGAAAVVDALVQIAALHQLHHQACVCRILQAGAIHLQEDTDQSTLSVAIRHAQKHSLAASDCLDC